MTLVAAHILRTLRSSPLPVRTTELTLICCPDRRNARQQVWAELRLLRDAGIVTATRVRSTRTEGRGANQMVRAWRIAGRKS